MDILAQEDPLSFTHPLLRAAVYGRCHGAQAQMHRGAAAVMLAAHGPSEEIAAHLLEVPPAATAKWWRRCGLRRAGDGARRARFGGPLLERANREPASDADRAACSPSSAARRRSSAPHRAIEHLGGGIDLAAELRERAALAR